MDEDKVISSDHPAVVNGLIDAQGSPITPEGTPEIVVELAPVEAPEPPKQYVESNEERNFRNLRQKAERLERERDEAMGRLRNYESKQPQEDPDVTIAPDDLAEGKHINKVQNKIHALEQQLIETRLRSQYPDIDSVVSADNLSRLQQDYPDIANTIGSSKNLYSKAVSAYTIIKKLGIHSDVSPYEQEKALAHRNAAKPKPLASVSPQQGDSPLSNAHAFASGLSDDLKKKLHQEMIAAIRSR